MMECALSLIDSSKEKIFSVAFCVASIIGIFMTAHILSSIQRLRLSSQKPDDVDRAVIKLWLSPFNDQSIKDNLLFAGCNLTAINSFFRVVYMYRIAGLMFIPLITILYLWTR